jgi:hypothetical protein
LATKEHNNTTMTKQHCRSNVNDDGNDGMVETAAMTAMVMAMETMPPPLPAETMSMTTTAAFQGWQ